MRKMSERQILGINSKVSGKKISIFGMGDMTFTMDVDGDGVTVKLPISREDVQDAREGKYVMIQRKVEELVKSYPIGDQFTIEDRNNLLGRLETEAYGEEVAYQLLVGLLGEE